MIERELKFAIDPADVPRIRRALSLSAARRPARSTLVSTYFDTADGALKREKMALRVRKEGRRFLQTVKSEASRTDLSMRGEWEDPIGQETPDLSAAESGARVQQAIGTADLRPLFTTAVKRTTLTLRPLPATEIEAAIDEGDIHKPNGGARARISELELELKSGEPTALHDVALRLLDVAPLRLEARSKAERGYELAADGRQPPPVMHSPSFRFPADATVESMLQEVGRLSLLQVVRNEPAALTDMSEGVHQMRVAVRRARSALAMVKPLLSSEHYTWTNDALKSLAAALAAPRDWDVFAEHLLQPVIDALPEEEGLMSLARAVERERRAAYAAAKQAICAPQSTATILRLSRWFEARAWRDQPVSEHSAQLVAKVADLAPAFLAHRFRQAKKRSKSFPSLMPAERHKLRIALKKLRYTIDLLERLFAEDAVDGFVAPLKSLQDDLGYANDVRTARSTVARLSDGAEDQAIPRAVGIVLGWHDRGLADHEKDLRKHVRRFRREKPFW